MQEDRVMPMTGNNQSFGENVAGNLFSNSVSLDSTSIMDNFSNNVMGTESKIGESKFSDPAFMFDHIYDQASAQVHSVKTVKPGGYTIF
ncbi:unnamed protein product [Prunus brigantina]